VTFWDRKAGSRNSSLVRNGPNASGTLPLQRVCGSSMSFSILVDAKTPSDVSSQFRFAVHSSAKAKDRPLSHGRANLRPLCYCQILCIRETPPRKNYGF